MFMKSKLSNLISILLLSIVILQMAFFVGLLFFSIAVTPKVDVGLDQELALPTVRSNSL